MPSCRDEDIDDGARAPRYSGMVFFLCSFFFPYTNLLIRSYCCYRYNIVIIVNHLIYMISLLVECNMKLNIL
jgi:hypothetical protein